jgi:hypothetical protein
MADKKTPFERDEDGDLTIRGQIAMLRDIRDYANIGSTQRDDLSYLIGNLCFKLSLEGEEE